MKTKTGFISGFVIGVTSFLLLFKILFLDYTPPSDELAPGIVVIIAGLNGLLLGLIGSRIQKQMINRKPSNA